uniref:Uncharacterized protein n=1 Tax=Cacopsylla melanoneura TaxID=428564 RepID=A0A8D8LBF6_9HEMI
MKPKQTSSPHTSNMSFSPQTSSMSSSPRTSNMSATSLKRAQPSSNQLLPTSNQLLPTSNDHDQFNVFLNNAKTNVPSNFNTNAPPNSFQTNVKSNSTSNSFQPNAKSNFQVKNNQYIKPGVQVQNNQNQQCSGKFTKDDLLNQIRNNNYVFRPTEVTRKVKCKK